VWVVFGVAVYWYWSTRYSRGWIRIPVDFKVATLHYVHVSIRCPTNISVLRLLLHQGAELVVVDLAIRILVGGFDDLADFVRAYVLVAEQAKHVLQLAAANEPVMIRVEGLEERWGQ
jgi:hypothetical protein